MKPGLRLQQLVQTLERLTASSGVQIESPKFLRDKDTGRLREHDVVLTYRTHHHEIVVALECKDRSRKVGVPDIEAFKSKCNGTGVNRGVIVSSKGFTKTALEKAYKKDLDCFKIEEIDQFDWCQAPGVECREREVVDGPHFRVFPLERVEDPGLYDVDGNHLDNDRLNDIVSNCFSNRAPEVAAAQDEAASSSVVGVRFIDPKPSQLYVRNRDGTFIGLKRLEILLQYRVKTSIIPFSFQKYSDRSDKEIYTAAFAPVNVGKLQGDIVLHKAEEHLEVLFVHRNQ